ncbi:MAG TPA: extracellular solute-binding protein [Candidatus Xenobia bacterium]
MKRVWMSVALGLMLAGPAVADDAHTPMVVWYALKAPYGDQFGQMLKRYEATHPYLSVQPRNYIDSDALRQALATAPTLPDVALIDVSWQDQLIDRQKIVAVQDLMAGTGAMATIVAKVDTFTCLYNLSCRDGKLWTLPTFATDTALVYNTDLFKAKGIKKPPVNWGDLVVDAKQLTDPARGLWGFELPSNADLGRLYSLMLWEMGADMLNAADQAQPVAAIPPSPPVLTANPVPGPAPAAPATPAAGSTPAASPTPAASSTPAAGPTASPTPQKPAAERLVGFMTDLVYKYRVSPPTDDADPSHYAMFLGSPETLLQAENKGLPMMAAPFPINKIKVEHLTSYGFAVTRDAHDKSEAYQFAKWATDFEQSVAWTTSAPFLPANKQVTLSPQYFQFLTQHPGLRVFLREMNVGRLEPVVPHYRRILREIGDALANALAQHEDVNAAALDIAVKTHYIQSQPQGSNGPAQ